MEKIYVIKGSNGKVEFISSAVTSEKLAKTLCEFKNLTDKWEFSYEAVEILWNKTDLEYLQNRINEITEERSKELPF